MFWMCIRIHIHNINYDFYGEILKIIHFYHFESDPRFPKFYYMFNRWKSGVAFVRRCFRDDKLNQRNIFDLIPHGDPSVNIGIKHGFLCINICWAPREMLKQEPERRGVQPLPGADGGWGGGGQQMLMYQKSMFYRYYCIG